MKTLQKFIQKALILKGSKWKIRPRKQACKIFNLPRNFFGTWLLSHQVQIETRKENTRKNYSITTRFGTQIAFRTSADTDGKEVRACFFLAFQCICMRWLNIEQLTSRYLSAHVSWIIYNLVSSWMCIFWKLFTRRTILKKSCLESDRVPDTPYAEGCASE